MNILEPLAITQETSLLAYANSSFLNAKFSLQIAQWVSDQS